MNLAVHGLEGNIQKAITYYEDPHELVGKADYVMANPPFNVDEIDADKVKTDPRLPFGLPGVNKKDKVSNGNYVWISYFYSYLNEKGRAGFVMSSQASSAGRDEAKVRQKLIETGDVDIMVAIRSNFFYTRTVPCELWFLNRDKPKAHKNKVLMIDARNVYTKVTRKIYDFSPEQEQNLMAIVWLYRGQQEKFLELVSGYLREVIDEGQACFEYETVDDGAVHPLPDFEAAISKAIGLISPFIKSFKGKPKTPASNNGSAPIEIPAPSESLAELKKELKQYESAAKTFQQNLAKASDKWEATEDSPSALSKLTDKFTTLAEAGRDLVRDSDLIYKLTARVIETCENACEAKDHDDWNSREITAARKSADEARQLAVVALKQVRYFWRQAHWLVDRFPDGKLVDVKGLVRSK